MIGKYAFTIDGWLHKLHIHSHNVCLAADITVGWGPDCLDWELNETRFLRWFYKWYWNGPDIYGERNG